MCEPLVGEQSARITSSEQLDVIAKSAEPMQEQVMASEQSAVEADRGIVLPAFCPPSFSQEAGIGQNRMSAVQDERISSEPCQGPPTDVARPAEGMADSAAVPDLAAGPACEEKAPSQAGTSANSVAKSDSEIGLKSLKTSTPESGWATPLSKKRPASQVVRDFMWSIQSLHRIVFKHDSLQVRRHDR